MQNKNVQKNGRRSGARLSAGASLEFLGVIEERKAAFRNKFGRAPAPGEPLFFDPEATEPRRLPAEARRAALAEIVDLLGMPRSVMMGDGVRD